MPPASTRWPRNVPPSPPSLKRPGGQPVAPGAAVFVAPNAHGVSVAQDRIAEKRFVGCAAKSGVLPAPHKVIACRNRRHR
jgi:hypothetical protein